MIVFAESNFVLELALQQEEFEHADQILRLAEEKKLRLTIPACSLIEPYQTLVRRRNERKDLSRRLLGDLKLLGRTKAHAALGSASAQVAQALETSIEVEREALERTIQRLARVCDVLPVSAESVTVGQGHQLIYGLEPYDAVVFATLHKALVQLPKGHKVFVNKDAKDFANPYIEGELAKYECRLITSFSDARRFIENEFNKRFLGDTR